MGAQQSMAPSESTLTIEKTVVQHHMEKLEVLKSELLMKTEENQFLRKRIVNDLTDHASQLEHELRREKSRRLAQTRTIDKYTKLCRKLEEDLQETKAENESLLAENNRLLSELLLNFEQVREEEEKEDSATYQLLKVQRRLEQVKADADLVKRKLLEEINNQKRNAEELELSKAICEYNSCKEKLQSERIDISESAFPDMEQEYRILCSENTQKKINVVKEAQKIEGSLQDLSEQLNLNIAGITAETLASLQSHDSALQLNLKKVSFAGDYRREKEFWTVLMNIVQDEIKYFEKVLLYTKNEKPKQETDVRLNDYSNDNGVDNGNVVNLPTTWSTVDAFDESEA